jgi:magnesium transporter
MDVLTRVDRERIADLRGSDTFFWLDLESPSQDQLDALGELLGLHPLALEDTREFGQRPKLDAYDDHVLLVFYTARIDADAIVPIEVHLHISGGWVVTVRRDRCVKLDALHDLLRRQGTEPEQHLVYQILDALTDAFYPVIDHIEQRIDGLEAEVLLVQPRREHLVATYRLKQDVHAVQRRVAPQRDHFQTSSTAITALPGLSRGTHEYMRDVADHLAQIAGELQRQSEDLTSLAQTYFNANASRLNETATRLTVIATFFVIWTLVTGFFGQNFGWLVGGVSSRTDFLVFGIGGLLVPSLIFAAVLWVKRRDWF